LNLNLVYKYVYTIVIIYDLYYVWKVPDRVIDECTTMYKEIVFYVRINHIKLILSL